MDQKRTKNRIRGVKSMYLLTQEAWVTEFIQIIKKSNIHRHREWFWMRSGSEEARKLILPCLKLDIWGHLPWCWRFGPPVRWPDFSVSQVQGDEEELSGTFRPDHNFDDVVIKVTTLWMLVTIYMIRRKIGGLAIMKLMWKFLRLADLPKW